MAWTTPGTAVAGEVLEAAFWNEQVRDNLNLLYTPPMCRAERNTTQSINNDTATFISFDNQIFDTDTIFAPTSDTFTIKTAGVYVVTAGVFIQAVNAGNVRVAYIMKNPSGPLDTGARIASNGAYPPNAYQTLIVSTIHSFAVNDTIKLSFYHDRGQAINIGNASEDTTFLAVSWVGFAP